MEHFKIYIVEDDPWYGELLKYHLSLNEDYEVHLFSSAKDCLANLYKKPQVVCIDFGLPDMSGDKLLQQILHTNPHTAVVVISGQEMISVAVNLLKAGARDYIIKDDNTTELLWNSILKIRENVALRHEVAELKEQLEQKFDFAKSIIGQSSAIKKTFSLIEKAIHNPINVSITGETGTGKELVAKAIHYNSERKKKPFVAVNMAAIPHDLMESELFGYEKGAFTGALVRRVGKFEEAQGGTLFLDEIAEMDLNLQSKILRVLQEREVIRIGGNEKVKLDIRLITATHKDLAQEVRQGKFREDLYYRVMGLPIPLPPLRERGNDILVLAKHFADDFAKESKKGKFTLQTDAKNKLLGYHFPGNVRELKAVMELACVMCEGKEIKAEDITFPAVKGEEAFMLTEKTLKSYTEDIILHFLQKYDQDVLLVAEKLDIGKSTIYNLLKQQKEKNKN
jgi:DNA-binding NtrC family response regulator